MELNQSNLDMETVKDVVERVFNVNIFKNVRTRRHVEARMVYAKILRDSGHTYTAIGKSIYRDHSTIIHYTKLIDDLMSTEKYLKEKYVMCKEIVLRSMKTNLLPLEELNLKVEVEELNFRIKELLDERLAVLEITNRFARLENIINLIDKMAPVGAEEVVEEKIKNMFEWELQKKMRMDGRDE